MAGAGVPVIVPLNTNMDFPLERSLEDCLKAVEVKSLSRYFDDQLDAAEELYGIQLHFNINTNDVKVLIDSYRIAYSQEICDRCEALIRRQMLHYGYLVRWIDCGAERAIRQETTRLRLN